MAYNYGYDYGYYDYAEPVIGGVAGFLMVFVLLFYLLMLAYFIVTYVLQSLGMYSIAKRRGIHHAWLAWIPVGNGWLLGSISDQYQYVAKGRVRNRRKALLGLEIALAAVIAVIFIASFAIGLFSALEESVLIGSMIGIVVLLYIAILALVVIDMVFRYIALYDLYASCDPGNAVLYLVLSILLNVTQPFFIFFNRKKDQGMPPRKAPPQIETEAFTEAPEAPAEQASEPGQEVPVPEAAPQEDIPVEPVETPLQEPPTQEPPVDSASEEDT